MTTLLTSEQMRVVEQAAMAAGDVTGLELMERAGRGVVEAAFDEWPELAAAPYRALILCGPGNNGGDGFVIARLLRESGWDVETFLYGRSDALPPDARRNYERWDALGRVTSLSMPVPIEEELQALRSVSGAVPDLVVDALFGTGLTRPVEGLCAVFDALRIGRTDEGTARKFRTVSVDIPSGLCADSGEILRENKSVSVHANLTVTFHRFKRGHFLADGPASCGRTVLKSIGLSDRSTASEREALARLHGVDGSPGHLERHITACVTQDRVKPTIGKTSSHKYQSGHALILTGGAGKTGAARLAARGALRIGAGLVTLGCPHQALPEVAAHVTAIMCRPLDGAPGLHEALHDNRLNALCLGPGLGMGLDTQSLVLEALGSKRSIVLDADALTRFERNPEVLFEALHEDCVITPHGGEFGRLFPDIKEKFDAPPTSGPAYSKVDATRAAAERAGCVVLFKGPDTVIAAPDGRSVVNASMYDRAVPWLGTAGSGDVLAGFVTGLLSRGFSPFEAATSAAWLHTECALSFGPGLIAEDLPECLPAVFRKLGL